MGNKLRNKWLNRFRKWHKWPGLFIGLLLILWSFSGIILNHREFFSGLDIERSWMPDEYLYKNWNNSSVKGSINYKEDSLLIYGNIGVWVTDREFSGFREMNAGFGEGIDNRKASCLLKSSDGNIYAGTYFGLFYFNELISRWEKIDLPVKEQRITDIIEKDSSIMVLTRSELLISDDNPDVFRPVRITLPPPEGYDDKVGLFKTLWVIHSGEIYGLAGKLIVDLVGLIFIILTITGVIHFFIPGMIRKRKKNRKNYLPLTRFKRGTLKWHNRIATWTITLLLVTAITGMFLRPPLLITIANTRVGKISYSVLDNPNPWTDKLRAIRWDENLEKFLVSTSDGMYISDEKFRERPRRAPGAPPVSVMGINVFEKLKGGNYLIGSFSGLFLWNPGTARSVNYITGEIPGTGNTTGKPIGDYLISGLIRSENNRAFIFDYNMGVLPVGRNQENLLMPEKISGASPMSLWNFALEIHTARFFKFILGDFYILIIPIFGLAAVVVLISGLVVWIKLWARKRSPLKSPRSLRPMPVYIRSKYSKEKTE